jgi:pyrroloquinoline-quinone synthase
VPTHERLGPDDCENLQDRRNPAALDYVKTHAKTPEERAAVCNALIFKTNVLWVQLDALYHAYVNGHVPPGAFVPSSS